MDKNITYAAGGAAGAAVIQGLMARFGDRLVAPMLYSATQYAVDLKKAGYIYTVASASDADVGAAIVSATGYEFAVGSPTNLVGTNKRTATIDTYMAAVGQKVAPYMLPSVWGTGVVGVVGIADSMNNWLVPRDYQIAEAAVGGGLIGAAVLRAIPGITGVKVYPSGFDTVATATTQYLDANVQANLRQLSERNSQLQSEVNTLRAQIGRATGQVQIPPVINVTEIPRNPNEYLRNQQFMGTPGTGPVDPKQVQFMSNIATLEKAFL